VGDSPEDLQQTAEQEVVPARQDPVIKAPLLLNTPEYAGAFVFRFPRKMVVGSAVCSKLPLPRASVLPGPFQDFYQRIRWPKASKADPGATHAGRARLQAITLTLWKKGENFDAEKTKTASRLERLG